MNPSKYQELQNAVEILRNSIVDKNINLDFSIDSVKHLDYILETAFKNGKLKNPNGAFAQHLGLMMLGLSGYVAEVFLKNTANAKLDIDENNENWYTDFKVISENGRTLQPAIRVVRRADEGRERELYAYALSAIKYFNTLREESTNTNTYIEEVYVRDDLKQEIKKACWKFW